MFVMMQWTEPIQLTVKGFLIDPAVGKGQALTH